MLFYQWLELKELFLINNFIIMIIKNLQYLQVLFLKWSRWRESNSRLDLGKVAFYHWTTSAHILWYQIIWNIKIKFIVKIFELLYNSTKKFLYFDKHIIIIL